MFKTVYVSRSVVFTCSLKVPKVFSRLHWKDNLNSQYIFFCRIFVTVSFVSIFKFIDYANNTTCDITLHNDVDGIACFVAYNNRK